MKPFEEEKTDFIKGGRLLREKRIDHGLTQKQLAQLCECSVKRVRDAERNAGTLTLPLMNKMSSILGVQLKMELVYNHDGISANPEVCKRCDESSCLVKLCERLSHDGTTLKIKNYEVPKYCNFTTEHVVSQERPCQKRIQKKSRKRALRQRCSYTSASGEPSKPSSRNTMR